MIGVLRDLLTPWICVATSIVLALLGLFPFLMGIRVQSKAAASVATVVYLAAALLGFFASHLQVKKRFESVATRTNWLTVGSGVAASLGLMLALLFLVVGGFAAMPLFF